MYIVYSSAMESQNNNVATNNMSHTIYDIVRDR
eukprot:SAG22_NODE_2911_length_2109_cov_8.543781_1_plen_32_part_10